MNDRPINVQRTLKYGAEKVTKTLLGFALVLFLVGLVDELFIHDRRFPGLLVMIAGGGWAMWEFWRLHNPGKPLLMLSPAGISIRVGGVKEVQIPWGHVRSVGTVDVSAVHPTAPWRVRFPDVTVFEVSRHVYEKYINPDSALLRGPGWENTFIQKGDAVQIALHQQVLPIEPDVLREEIEARRKAFADQPQADNPPRVIEPTKRVKVLQYAVVAVSCIALAYIFAARNGLLDAWEDHRRDRRLAEIAREHEEWKKQAAADWERFERESQDKSKKLLDVFEKGSQHAAAPAVVSPPQPPRPSQENGHRGAIQWLAVAPQGKTFLSAAADGAVKLWDIGDMNVLRDVGLHRIAARAVFALPDGGRALSAGDDGEIVLRALADGRVLHVFAAPEHGGVRRLAVSGDGRRAASVHSDGAAIVWDIENRALQHVLTGGGIRTIAISADGARAIGGGLDGKLRLWDVNAPSLLRTFDAHRGAIYGVAFTPDATRVVSGGFDALRLWDAESGREVRTFSGHADTVYTVAVSDDGRRVLSGSFDGTARLWDITTGKEIARFGGKGEPLNAVAFSVDGGILTGGADRAIRLWTPGGELVRLFPGNWSQVPR